MRYAAYGPIRNWQDYITYSQTAQGDAIRWTADIQRAGTGRDKSGFWYYKFSDCFPGHSWAVVDYYGTAKLSYYRAKQASRPKNSFITSPKLNTWEPGERFHAELHVVNDSRESLNNAYVQVLMYNSQLTEVMTWKYPALNVKPGLAACIDQLGVNLPEKEAIQPFLIAIMLYASSGALISDQWYWFNAQPKTAELLAFEREHQHEENEYPGDQARQAFSLYADLPAAPLRELPLPCLNGLSSGKIRAVL
ncbi:hypothetical protein N6H13_29850 [Paenibacillus sp. CC-CFT742]|nr:hypothetical protein [Paenibacillus sp. CC-CFT742]WJH29046.1 hypothetical protein N6H13_29850 [Paenibacillus sp. CC-CFT742]